MLIQRYVIRGNVEAAEDALGQAVHKPLKHRAHMNMHYPETVLYHQEALWARTLGNGEAVVGVTYFAQNNLGEVIYLDLPEVGYSIIMGKSFGSIESQKAMSDLIAPVSGSVVEVNAGLRGDPGLVNKEPYESGWFLRIRLNNADELNQLMNAESYIKYLG